MSKDLHDIIIRPIITEKSFKAMEKERKYTFKVPIDVNKIEIKKAVEEIFKVRVSKVNTIRFRGKPRRLGIYRGRKPDWKKAIVTLAPGYKIPFFENIGV
ncbi:MAG: 50S ribosomal protein L23 [Synergistetes bacterium]|nr:50S ribosomal protein L23 [Synergistota bacterium]MCX8128072.1 50S ribosomal protein L23 [Synergistota bacterium]MDW8192448.1 50S ribosomal protein L23 [Synergistota bacterium]